MNCTCTLHNTQFWPWPAFSCFDISEIWAHLNLLPVVLWWSWTPSWCHNTFIHFTGNFSIGATKKMWKIKVSIRFDLIWFDLILSVSIFGLISTFATIVPLSSGSGCDTPTTVLGHGCPPIVRKHWWIFLNYLILTVGSSCPFCYRTDQSAIFFGKYGCKHI